MAEEHNLDLRQVRGSGPSGRIVKQDVETLLAQSREAQWCSLVNGTELYINDSGSLESPADDCVTYNVYYTEEFMRAQFPHATINKPVNGEMQHCCELT